MERPLLGRGVQGYARHLGTEKVTLMDRWFWWILELSPQVGGPGPNVVKDSPFSIHFTMYRVRGLVD